MSVCNSDSEENKLHSALELNELGVQLYKSKTPDKIALIQSAALLNAAIAKQPLLRNQKLEEDLNDLCNHVLDCANAKLKKNLVEISKNVKKEVNQLRTNINGKLQQLEKLQEFTFKDPDHHFREEKYIRIVKSIQRETSENFKSILASISQKCIEILGQPPNKFALVGLESLARNEITAYSHFQHFIVLQNYNCQRLSKKILRIEEYFCWYSCLFHIIIINFQETPLSNLKYSSISNIDSSKFVGKFIEKGFSLDGLLPLANGPQTKELGLINTVDKIVKCLESDDADEDYKPSYTSEEYCFVDGDTTVYQTFCSKVNSSSTLIKRSHNFSAIEEELSDFNLSSKLNFFAHSGVCIRQLVTLLFLLVAALGCVYEIKKTSRFEIVEKLTEKKLMSRHTAHRLMHTLAVTWHIKYRYAQKMRGDIICSKDESWCRKNLKVVANDISKCSLIKSFLSTLYLQFIFKQNNFISFANNCVNYNPLKENETWSKLLMLTFRTMEIKIRGLDEVIDVDSHYISNDEDKDVLRYLARSYFNCKQKPTNISKILKSCTSFLMCISPIKFQISLVKRIRNYCLKINCRNYTLMLCVGLLFAHMCLKDFLSFLLQKQLVSKYYFQLFLWILRYITTTHFCTFLIFLVVLLLDPIIRVLKLFCKVVMWLLRFVFLLLILVLYIDWDYFVNEVRIFDLDVIRDTAKLAGTKFLR